MANSGAAKPNRRGLPVSKSVLATLSFAPGGRSRPIAHGAPSEGVGRATYRIFRTDEVDAKDSPLSATERNSVLATGAAVARVSGDSFAGTAREVAKLSISNATVESFNDIKDLIASFPPKAQMVRHEPPITTDQNSGRVTEEERNISAIGFLYAASQENDNDYHLIIGRDTASQPPMYMTMEISGLPAQSEPSFATLKASRDAYKAFFGNNLPGASYDFYDPPIPVKVKGSLFFDMSHARGKSPGPPSLHPDMPVIWEVHPITDIQFES